MKAENENLTAHQSLDIIAGMIKQAQGNARRSNFHFLMWGWVIVFANIGMYILLQMHYSMPYLVWTITIPACFISFYKGYQQRKEERVKTYLDSISAWMWGSFAVCVFTIVFFGFKINYQLSPLILLISAIPTLLSGVVLRFKPLFIGGISFWIFGILSFLVPMQFQNLIGAAAVICGYLIPGYLLRNTQEA